MIPKNNDHHTFVWGNCSKRYQQACENDTLTGTFTLTNVGKIGLLCNVRYRDDVSVLLFIHKID